VLHVNVRLYNAAAPTTRFGNHPSAAYFHHLMDEGNNVSLCRRCMCVCVGGGGKGRRLLFPDLQRKSVPPFIRVTASPHFLPAFPPARKVYMYTLTTMSVKQQL
jgi:hypothetical protein